MNNEWLHYFELTYDELNYSAAARRVPVSPQGLTKAIHALEKELDVVLFSNDPLTGLLMPTGYAHELYEYACVAKSNWRLLEESFARLRGEERHKIRLGCSLGTMGALGPEFLNGFKALHPTVDVAYWETNDRLCDEGLAKGDYDLALSIAPYREGMVAEELYRCQLYYWVHRDHWLGGRDTLDTPDFAGCDIAIPGAGFKCYDRLLGVMADEGVKLGNVYEMSEIFQLYDFAESERGLGFTVEHVARLPIFNRNSDVRAIPVTDTTWGFGITRLPTHALGDAERAFWDWCRAFSKHMRAQ